MPNKFLGQFALSFFLGLSTAWGSICGPVDDRRPSFDSRIGRIKFRNKSFCSGTLVSHHCFVTADHCLRFPNDPEEVQFNVYVAGSTSDILSFPVDKARIFSSGTEKKGGDWGVIWLKNSPILGKAAGELQGHVSISEKMPFAGQEVKIIGHGNSTSKARRYMQQIGSGQLAGINLEMGQMRYKIDTAPCNSGSPIMDIASDELIGVHTQEGCKKESRGMDRYPGTNAGYSIMGPPGFRAAIQKCLDLELQ